MFGRHKRERIEPHFSTPVPDRTLLFRYHLGEHGTTVSFTRDGMSQVFVENLTEPSSAHMLVAEGLRRLARGEPDRPLAVEDPSGGYSHWLTWNDRSRSRRDASVNLPYHEVR
jgi:hypothetical protein